MKIVKYPSIEPTHMENDVAKGIDARVVIGKADNATNFCMRVFEIAPGGHTPRHSHDWEHEIFFHSGSGEVWTGEAWASVENGCAVFVPGGTEHQIKNTGDETLVFVCLVPAGAPEL